MGQVKNRSVLKSLFPCGLAFMMVLIILLPAAYFRNIDADEGYALYASRLVVQGKTPYLDFFYQQMPLLPYIVGGWMSVFGFSWFGGRTLSVFGSLLISGLLFSYLKKRCPDRRIVAGSLLLFAFNGLIIAWFTVAKVYTLSSLFLVGSFLSLSSWHSGVRLRYRYLPLAGFLLGMAANIRLYLAVLVPVLLTWIVMNSFREVNLPRLARNVLIFVAGWIAASAWSIGLLLKDPGAFYFDNLGYHLQRSALGFSGALSQKAATLYQLVSSPQLLMLFGLVIGSGIILLYHPRKGVPSAGPESPAGAARPARSYFSLREAFSRSKDEMLAFLVLSTLALVSLWPTPTFTQYFSIGVPFVIVLLPPSLSRLLKAMGDRPGLLSWGLVFYVLLAPPTIYYELKHVGGDRPEWRVSQMRAIGREVARVTGNKDQILTWWPGYAFAAGRSIVPGMENHFGLYLSNQWPADTVRRYKIASREDVRELIAGKKARVVVAGYWAGSLGEDELKIISTLLQENYDLYRQVGLTKIYLPRPDN